MRYYWYRYMIWYIYIYSIYLGKVTPELHKLHKLHKHKSIMSIRPRNQWKVEEQGPQRRLKNLRLPQPHCPVTLTRWWAGLVGCSDSGLNSSRKRWHRWHEITPGVWDRHFKKHFVVFSPQARNRLLHIVRSCNTELDYDSDTYALNPVG